MRDRKGRNSTSDSLRWRAVQALSRTVADSYKSLHFICVKFGGDAAGCVTARDKEYDANIIQVMALLR